MRRNSRFRPNRSVSWPKNSAPRQAPATRTPPQPRRSGRRSARSRSRLGQPRRDAADDGDLEAVEDPHGAEPDHDQPVETGPWQPVESRRDLRLDGAHAGGATRQRRPVNSAHGRRCVRFTRERLPARSRATHLEPVAAVHPAVADGQAPGAGPESLPRGLRPLTPPSLNRTRHARALGQAEAHARAVAHSRHADARQPRPDLVGRARTPSAAAGRSATAARSAARRRSGAAACRSRP